MDYQIIWADKINETQIEELKNIWVECFHDSREYVDFFFRKRFDPSNTAVAVYNDHMIGVTYLLPATLCHEKYSDHVMYGYAVGVREEFRRQGVCKRIQEFIIRYCDNNHLIYAIHPANQKLAAYYEKLGLKEAGNILKASFVKQDIREPGLDITDIASWEYEKLRDLRYKKQGYLKWDITSLEYVIAEQLYCGGFCKKLIYNSEEYCILGKCEDDQLFILETSIPDEFLPDIMQRLVLYYHVPKVVVNLPVNSKVQGTVVLQIMSNRISNIDFGYWNLLLN